MDPKRLLNKQTMQYDQALNFLDSLQFFTIKLGLVAVEKLLSRLGSPQKDFPCVHIAGTNGKGSVGATLMTILAQHGYRVGFYSSPHLHDVRERFTINGQMIPQQEFAVLMDKIKRTLGKDSITYFECTTALAFLWFSQQKVDLALIETGLGGRLDATNVLTPLLSVITNISLDHQQYLGETIAQIAREKAGIIKENVPVIGGDLSTEALQVIQEVSNQKKAPLFLYNTDFKTSNRADGQFHYHGLGPIQSLQCQPNLTGDHQVTNTALALAALELLAKNNIQIDNATVQSSLHTVQWPGRMERVNYQYAGKAIPIWLDGAHNQAGVQALIHSLHQMDYDRLILIWGSMKDKHLGKTWTSLLRLADSILYTQAEPVRSAPPELLLESTPSTFHKYVSCHATIEETLDQACVLWKKGDLICVAGSLYLVGAMRKTILSPPPQQTKNND